MMTMPLTMLTMFFQAGLMVQISVDRVQEFLMLPELKVKPQDEPLNNQISVELINGTFIWSDSPEIQLRKRDKELILKEAIKLRKTIQKEAARLKDKEKKQKKIENQQKNG
ncbi:MAG: hypothetical protein EZS28_003802 [Streblomastix strix]|uniref:Uncharacterized protein n=1 Tax=Streblomastix strix TaxID=222440 RepID=A0A5J4X1Y8_9EUKA|nr:MAG: hypothetical protein EZS28_003802 [Streblomastix strix]